MDLSGPGIDVKLKEWMNEILNSIYVWNLGLELRQFWYFFEIGTEGLDHKNKESSHTATYPTHHASNFLVSHSVFGGLGNTNFELSYI